MHQISFFFCGLLPKTKIIEAWQPGKGLLSYFYAPAGVTAQVGAASEKAGVQGGCPQGCVFEESATCETTQERLCKNVRKSACSANLNCHTKVTGNPVPEVKQIIPSTRFDAARAVAAPPFALFMDAMPAAAPTVGASPVGHPAPKRRQRWGACQLQSRGHLQRSGVNARLPSQVKIYSPGYIEQYAAGPCCPLKGVVGCKRSPAA